ncbi:MAG: hypothetical protein K9J13_01935 [Saprospiraceae bacterium]|nr:hypothetical protein [Saprospiraceae bacterium]
MINLIVFGSLGLIIILFVIIRTIKKKKEIELNLKKEEQLNLFKNKADKIKVDLSNAVLKSNSWSEDIVVNNSNSGALNQLAGQGYRNINTIQHNENVIKISVPYKDTTIEIKHNINIESQTLKMKLALKEETILYVNPNNTHEYYLDLEFLG